METLIYDGSFAGWLTAVFEVYEYKLGAVTITPADSPAQSLFGATRQVITVEEKAARVWKGLELRTSRQAARQVYHTFLSEEEGVEAQLLSYLLYAFGNKHTIEYDYSHPAVRYVMDMNKKIRREKHRMEAFVRFQQTKDNIYYAVISPDYNVLPLLQQHFEQRYAGQLWVIYDTRRKYGLYYDLQTTNFVEINLEDNPLFDEKEEKYQELWQHYFDNVNIKARKNLRLHVRHMPLRYWKYLPEKQPRRS
jgi:probable DNA metabolism protein